MGTYLHPNTHDDRVRSLVIIYVTLGFHLGGGRGGANSRLLLRLQCSEHCSSFAQYSWIEEIESRKGEGEGESYSVAIVLIMQSCLSFRIKAI